MDGEGLYVHHGSLLDFVRARNYSATQANTYRRFEKFFERYLAKSFSYAMAATSFLFLTLSFKNMFFM